MNDYEETSMEWQTLLLGVGLGMVLLPIALFFLFRLALWLIMRKLKRVAAQLASSMTPPMEIKLQPMAKVSWNNPAVESQGLTLQALGFSTVGAFEVAGIAGTRLSAWLNSSEKCYGVVYEHPQAGSWCDIVSMYEDGTSCTHSSAPDTGLEQNPKHPNTKLPEQPIETLTRQHYRERKDGARRLFANDFSGDFERCYAECMAWRAQKGTSREEIIQIARLSGESYRPEVIEQALVAQNIQEQAQLQDLLRAQFLKKTSLSPAEWEEVRDRLIFIHDGMDEDELEDLDGLLEDGTPRQRAKGLANYLGSLSEPVECDVYALPEIS